MSKQGTFIDALNTGDYSGHQARLEKQLSTDGRLALLSLALEVNSDRTNTNIAGHIIKSLPASQRLEFAYEEIMLVSEELKKLEVREGMKALGVDE